MSEEKTKREKRPLGGIRSPFSSFGSENGEGEESETAVQTSEHPAVQSVKSSEFQTARSPESENTRLPEFQTAKPSNVKVSKHPEWEQQTVYLPPALKMKLKVHAVQAKLEISEIVSLALREYLERHP